MGNSLCRSQSSRPISAKNLHRLKVLPCRCIQRISANVLSVETFRCNFEATNTPVLIDGCCDNWAAMEWTLDSLEAQFGELTFEMSWNSSGGQEMKLAEYFHYMKIRGPIDANPRYLFEDLSYVRDVDPKGALLRQFAPPEYFGKQYDLFELGYLQSEDWPPHRKSFRWIIIGPAGSGTGLHIDPDNTSAWNALLRGTKRWVLLPPDVEGISCEFKGGAAEWFKTVLPRLRDSVGDKVIEVTQQRGDLVFIPAGWFHAVLNCEETICVTQNFRSLCDISRESFDAICQEVLRVRTPFADQWLSDLRSVAPELAARADVLVQGH